MNNCISRFILIGELSVVGFWSVRSIIPYSVIQPDEMEFREMHIIINKNRTTFLLLSLIDFFTVRK
jgi:hypothetical protein